MSKFLLSVAALMCLVGVARSADAPTDNKAKAYPLTTCIVTDEKLDDDAVMRWATKCASTRPLRGRCRSRNEGLRPFIF